MAKKFSDLTAKMSEEHRARASQLTSEMLAQMPLQELRKARELSQEAIAETLDMKQASVSKLERRADMYVSSLRSFIEAMGGELDIIAKFPEGSVRITQFQGEYELT